MVGFNNKVTRVTGRNLIFNLSLSKNNFTYKPVFIIQYVKDYLFVKKWRSIISNFISGLDFFDGLHERRQQLDPESQHRGKRGKSHFRFSIELKSNSNWTF